MSDTKQPPEQPPEGFTLALEESRQEEAASAGVVARDVEFEPSDEDVYGLHGLGLLGDGSAPDDDEVDDDSIGSAPDA